MCCVCNEYAENSERKHTIIKKYEVFTEMKAAQHIYIASKHMKQKDSIMCKDSKN